jgi:hypothetical protein
MSSTFLKMEEVDSALFYSSKAVSIIKNKKSKPPRYLLDHAAAIDKLGQHEKALSTAKEAYSLAKQIRMLTPCVMQLF